MPDSPRHKPFYYAIEHLLDTQKVMLYGRVSAIPEAELEAVAELLQTHYLRESAGYPGLAPKWDGIAGVWSAKVIFHAAQLLLYRSHEADELTDFFPEYAGPQTAAAHLSADICLRYLPALLHHLDAINPDDELIPILQALLQRWPYSNLLATKLPLPENLDMVTDDPCLAQLSADRIIATKHTKAADRSEFKPLVLAALGNHRTAYWKTLKTAPTP